MGRARRVPCSQAQNSGVVSPVAARASTIEVSMVEQNEDYDGDNDDEGEVAPNQHLGQQPQPQASGRPHGYNRNGRVAPPPQVLDHDHLSKLKLNNSTFDGQYVPNIYLTW